MLNIPWVKKKGLAINDGPFSILSFKKTRGLNEMAGDPVVLSDLAKGWDFFLTMFPADSASGMKVAAGLEGNRAWGLSFQDDSFSGGLHHWIWNRHSRKQCHGIRMPGKTVEVVPVGNLDNLSQVHDGNPMADMPDH